MKDLMVTYQRPTALIPRDSNPRTHSRKQIRQIADSITAFGFTNPIIVDDDNKVLAGHGRLAAATRLGLERVPTIRLSEMTDAQKRAYVLADNKLADNAGWDRDLLAIELGELIDLEVDIAVTGFDMAEIDLIIGEAGDLDPGADDVVHPPDPAGSVSTPGDLWRIGEHRLLCGDATEAVAYEDLLGNDQAQMTFTDPPYNVPIDGHVSGLGKNRHREFAMASGEMSRSAFTEFLRTVFGHMAGHSADGSIHFLCMDWRHSGEILAAGEAVYDELKNLCVWSKTNAGMGSLYRSQHELVWVFKKGAAPHVNNVELGKHGRYRTNVWRYAGANTFRQGRDADLADHPTVKPVAMVADAILDCSDRGGLVLDPFGGSGTTLIAAHRTGRRAAVMELDPVYVDLIIRRAQDLLGLSATLDATSETFDAVRSARQSASGEPAGPETPDARKSSNDA